MYKPIKKTLLYLFPKLIKRFEFAFRKILSLFYIGNNVYCNICESNFRRFINYEETDLICPRCGSLGRHRRLWSIVTVDLKPDGNKKILHFSPSRVIQQKLKRLYPNYVTTDFNGGLSTDKSFDITQIDEKNDAYDIIICYHVLEHIVNDKKAISELYRILKPQGELIIQTPFKNGNIYEDYSITSDSERKKHFGQEDHVRIYSVGGLRSRLEAGLFNVDSLNFKEEINNRNGFKIKESVLICNKKAI